MKVLAPRNAQLLGLGRSGVLRRLTTISAAISLLNAAFIAAGSTAPAASKGILTVSGMVRLNGVRAVTGQTVFAHSSIVTGEDADSSIAFDNQVRLRLAAKGDLAVDSFVRHLSGSLQTGTVSGFLPSGVSLDFRTSDVSISSTPSEPLVFTIQTNECEGTTIAVNQGKLELRSAGRKYILVAGESFSTATGVSGQSGQSHLSRKEKLGLFIGIGATVALLLAVVLGQNDHDQENPVFGGCVIVPSPGSPNTCM